MSSLEEAVVLDIIDSYEYWLLEESNASRAPKEPFRLSELTKESCLKKFRFRRQDIPQIAKAIRFPRVIRLKNRSKVPGVEALCIVLRRLASKGRGHDLVEIFRREE